MDTHKISVIVPVYNVALYIETCITSLLSQTYQNTEIIFIDDASTDTSLEICRHYEQLDSRVVVVSLSHNQGVSVARNCGVSHASGDYICFIDPDDYVAATYLEILYKNAVQYNADVSCCNCKLVDENSCFHYDSSPETTNNVHILSKDYIWEKLAISKGLRRTTLVVVWNKLIKKDIAKKLCFPTGKWHEDVFYTNHLFSIANVIVETDAQLYYYRQRSNSITSKENHLNHKHLDVIDAHEERISLCKEITSASIYKKMIVSYRNHILKTCKRYRRHKTFKQLNSRLLKSYVKYGHCGFRQFINHISLFFLN